MKETLRHHDLLQRLPLDNLPRLITIAAPPGYGKTIFAKQIASHYKTPIIWHTIDKWQRDVISLYQTGYQTWAQHLPLSPTQITHKVTPFDFAKDLAVAVNQHVKSPSLYILDDVHQLVGNKEIATYLNTLIEQLDDCITIALIGRSLPHLDWVAHYASFGLETFNVDDLRLTVPQVAELLKCSQLQAEQFVQRCSGWVTGIILAAKNTHPPLASNIAQIDESHTFNMLMQSYWRDISYDQQQFLLATSILETFTPAQCDALTISNAPHHIQSLLQQGLFIHQTNQGFRYHDLFRDFLQTSFKHQNAVQYQQAHQQAALWYESNYQLDQAIWHYLTAEDFVPATTLAEKIAKDYFIQGKWNSLIIFGDWLTGHNIPTLYLYIAVIQMDLNNITQANIAIEKSLRLFQQNGDVINTARAQLQQAHCLHRVGNYQQAYDIAQDILITSNIPDDIIAWAQRIQGCVAIEMADYEHAINHLKTALAIFGTHQYQNERLLVLQDLSSAYTRLGEIETASNILHEVIGIRREANNTELLALALNNLGYFYHCHYLYEDARRTINEAIALLAGSQSRTLAYLYWSLADLVRDLGDYNQADYYYQSAIALAQDNDQSLYERIILNIARLRLWQNRTSDGLHWLSGLLRASNNKLQTSNLYSLHTLFNILVNKSATQNTIIELRQQLDALYTQNQTLYLVQIMGAYLLTAQEYKSYPMQEHALSILAKLPINVWQPIVADFVHIDALSSYLSDVAIIQPSAIANIKTLQAQQPPTPSKAPQLHLTSLELKTFGKDQVSQDKHHIEPSQWTTTFARELFYYLYFHGAQTKQQLANQFWSDASPNQIRNGVHDTLKRLRRAVPNGVIFVDGYYQISEEYHIISDTKQFENAVSRALDLPPTNAFAIDLFDHAITLYEGDFLPNMLSDWVIDIREQMKQYYTDALLGRADCARVHHDTGKAIECYEQAIEFTPYDESIYRAMMLHYADLNNKYEIDKTYHRLKSKLAQDLQIAATESTTILYKRLMS